MKIDVFGKKTSMSKIVNAEVITIGDEILYGHITDTNTQWIGKELAAIGIRPRKKTSVADAKEDIIDALTLAHTRAELIIITGGLGPTKDDITKEALCDYFHTSLVEHAEALAFVTAFFAKKGRPMIESNRRQAWLPANCTYIENQWGTAPGMWFEHEGRVYISLPGVPFEMKNLMQHILLPKIKQHFETASIVHKALRTVGIGESFLSERIAAWEDQLPSHLKLAYLPSFSGVRLRLTGTGTDQTLIEQQIDRQFKDVFPLIREFVYGEDDEELEDVLARNLVEEGSTLSIAESCTGGAASARFTKKSGASAYFLGSVVSYSNDVKQQVLGVQVETLQQYGAVSEQTAREMAEGVRKLTGSTYGLATTGIAGPTGGTPEKPVGTVWIACATAESTTAVLLTLGAHREQNIEMTIIHLLNLLRKTMANQRNKTAIA
jgi:nicotinamide-nucleotide amidase